jgi:hypothetical protein
MSSIGTKWREMVFVALVAAATAQWAEAAVIMSPAPRLGAGIRAADGGFAFVWAVASGAAAAAAAAVRLRSLPPQR